MAIFSAFNERLPDPTFDVTDAGGQTTLGTGKKGPGFASVQVSSAKDTQISRTRSGRVVGRESGAHNWEISITYNPMTRGEFDVVQTFLDSRNSRLYPFYVVLPQHNKPKDPIFAVAVLSNTIKTNEAKPAGSSFIYIDINDLATTFTTIGGYPSPGDYFNIDDPSDLNHQKVYKITRVEKLGDYNSDFEATLPNAYRIRIHFTPPFVRDVPADALVRFNNPSFRVILKSDVLEYNLNTDNLYQFGLQLEEALP